jgi:hypothetical protein
VIKVLPVPFPEGVASPDGTLAFVELRDDGVCALELESGADHWRTTVAARPRLVVDRLLIAQDRTRSRGNILQFVALDIDRRGELSRPLDRVVLDDWVAVDDPDLEFDISLWAEDRIVVAEWRVESHYAGGAAAPPHVHAESRREARGRARLDLGTGRATREPPGTAPAVGADSGWSITRAKLPSEASRLVPADGQSAAVVGARLFYLVEPGPSSNGPRLVCVALESGRTLWERSLPPRPRARPPARRM